MGKKEKKEKGGNKKSSVAGLALFYFLGKILKPFLMRKLRSCFMPLLLLAAFAGAFFYVPDFAHNVRYYFLEGMDWVLEQTGLATQYDNLELGAPQGGIVDRVFEREGYAFGYSEIHEQPLWVTYKLTADELNQKKVGRTDDFREDPRIRTRSATPEDYKGSGFDRGHLAPAADMGWNKDVMSESFYMSNMSPQKPECNRGIWVDLESQVRAFARHENEIFVVTGPVFYNKKAVRSIGISNSVSIPHAYYKVVYDLTPPCKMIGFIIPNEGSKKNLKRFAVTVDTVEKVTGLTFFPALEASDQVLKKTISVSDWNWEKQK